MEANGMATTVGGEGDGGQRNSRLDAARLMREEQGVMVEAVRIGESPNRNVRRSEGHAAADYVAADTPSALPSHLWGNLPRELLLTILTRVPVENLVPLRIKLGTELTLTAEFIRACDEVHPNMAALLSFEGESNKFSVKVFDVKKREWLYSYEFRLCNHGSAPGWFDRVEKLPVWQPVAEDGGLVCFISVWKYSTDHPLCVVVMNPLTHMQHELPPLLCTYTVPPLLVHMKLDPATKQYQILVVGNEISDPFHFESYDSGSGQWTRALPSPDYPFVTWIGMWKGKHRHDLFTLFAANSSVYYPDECNGKVFEAGEMLELDGERVIDFGIGNNQQLFVLYKRVRRGRPRRNAKHLYFIREFQFPFSGSTDLHEVNQRGHWRVDRGTTIKLCAGGGILLVCSREGQDEGHFFHVMEATTGVWHALPHCKVATLNPLLTCRVFWNVVP